MQSKRKGTRIVLQNVLLVTDGVPSDNAAVLYGIELARTASFEVIQVVSSSLQNNILELDGNYGRRPKERSFISRSTVERKRFPIALLQIRDLHHFDLAIASASRKGGTKGLGEVVERILLTVHCPILVFGPGIPANQVPRAKMRTILYATDFSRQSFEAAQYAFSWAQEHQASLTMLHVVEGVRRGTLKQADSFIAPFRQWMEELVPDEVELWAEVETRIEFGELSQAILSTAHNLYADLIVLGANALSEVGESAVSAKSKQVLLKAECPVLLVREPMRERHSLPVGTKHELAAS